MFEQCQKRVSYEQFNASIAIISKNMYKKAKVIFLGDTAVGKSSIISALNRHPINNTHEPTIGMDFSIKIVEGKSGEYKLQLWDTAGQEKFRSIMPSYIRNSRIAIIVYDVTNLKSFNNLEKWIELFEDSCQKGSQLLLVGNKIDLYNNRNVSMEKVKKAIMEKRRYIYHQISAKSGEGVKELEETIAQELDKMNLELSNASTGNAEMQLRRGEKKINCCGICKKAQEPARVPQRSTLPPTEVIPQEEDLPKRRASEVSIEDRC